MAGIQAWELTQYQYAAEQMCYRLNVNPHEQVFGPLGEAPRWTEYAIRMHEFRVMTEAMRLSGLPLF